MRGGMVRRMNLSLKPNYSHREQRKAPDSNLCMQTAAGYYFKLKPFLAIRKDGLPPAYWPDKQFSRDLFTPNGFHYPFRWQPKLKEGWKRPTYEEFCAWYGLKERWVS